MRVEHYNLVYEEGRPGCLCHVTESQGQLYAFIQVLDLGAEHARFDEPIPKRYWGRWSWDDPEGSVRAIMEAGGKWPRLPAEE